MVLSPQQFTENHRLQDFILILSLIPPQYKKGLIFTLLHRLFSLCSSWVIFDIELSRLKSILLLNGYPLFLIDKCVTIFLDKIHSKQTNANINDNKTEFCVMLPFLGEILTSNS